MAAKVRKYPIAFLLAVERTLWWETSGRKDGAPTNDPADPGGITRWGIAQRFHPDVDVANLTKSKAIQIYFDKYWEPFGLTDLNDPIVASTVFDCMVNPGPASGTRCIQSTCVTLGEAIVVDSKLGPKTRAAINRLSNGSRPDILAGIAGQRFAYYWERAVTYPERRKFMRGWTRRALEDMALMGPDGEVIHPYFQGPTTKGRLR